MFRCFSIYIKEAQERRRWKYTPLFNIYNQHPKKYIYNIFIYILYYILKSAQDKDIGRDELLGTVDIDMTQVIFGEDIRSVLLFLSSKSLSCLAFCFFSLSFIRFFFLYAYNYNYLSCLLYWVLSYTYMPHIFLSVISFSCRKVFLYMYNFRVLTYIYL